MVEEHRFIYIYEYIGALLINALYSDIKTKAIKVRSMYDNDIILSFLIDITVAKTRAEFIAIFSIYMLSILTSVFIKTNKGRIKKDKKCIYLNILMCFFYIKFYTILLD